MLAGPNSRWNNYLVSRARGELVEFGEEMTRAIEAGEILLPQPVTQPANLAGGTNHCPNSDLSFSTAAATTAAITPATAGDTNQECYRFYRQQQGANIALTGAGALKAVGHSLFAGSEGATADIPRWDRVNGWAEIGSLSTQYDIAIHLLNNVINAGQPWFLYFRLGALAATLVPEDVQLVAGIWQKTATGEGWVEGDAFTITHQIVGAPGATAYEYRVLARTDSGVEMLSSVLSFANGPATLSDTNYVKLFYSGAAGFVEFQIYRKVGGVFNRVFTIRNSTDLQYNDTGSATDQQVQDWPSVSGSAPRALSRTSSLLVGSFGGLWQPNDMKIVVPPTYDVTQASAFSQFLRIGLTAPTGVARHIGIDRIFFSTTFNEWAPDGTLYPSGPSVSPTSGFQGGGTGVIFPPDDYDGGSSCVRVKTPVLVLDGRARRWKRYQTVRMGAQLPGENRPPYLVVEKKGGCVAEYYRVETMNGIWIECSVNHPFITDLARGVRKRAKHLAVGDRLACWVKGRKGTTAVKSVTLIPRVAEVGTFTLRDLSGRKRDGEGLYIAGHSKLGDRGLFCHNVKPAGILQA